MKERPILFSTAMISAILDGRKTQTRRVIKDQSLITKIPATLTMEHSKFGRPGDLLWVREKFSLLGYWDEGVPVHHIDGQNVIYYQEIGDFEWHDGDGYTEYRKDGNPRSHWKPSIFMKKEYCRIWLKIKDIRAARLQYISEEDAIAEGVEQNFNYDTGPIEGEWFKYPVEQYEDGFPAFSAKESFESLWDSINGEPRKNSLDISWKANPWVWVIEFERIER